jgi:hypothetical protein
MGIEKPREGAFLINLGFNFRRDCFFIFDLSWVDLLFYGSRALGAVFSCSQQSGCERNAINSGAQRRLYGGCGPASLCLRFMAYLLYNFPAFGA